MVELRVIQAVEEVDRARSRGGHAHAHGAGEFGVRGGHERGQFFVRGLDQFNLPLAAERADDAADAVARIAEHALDAPFVEALQ
jgi:hypothetical protein